MITCRSRAAEPPYSRISAEASALAKQAEVELLRRLLLRCDKYLAAVSCKARIDGEPDAYAEELRQDIALTLTG